MDASIHSRNSADTLHLYQRPRDVYDNDPTPRDVNADSAFVRAEIVAGRLDELVSRLDRLADRLIGAAPQNTVTGTQAGQAGMPHSVIDQLHQTIGRADSRISHGHDLLERLERVLP